MRRNKTIKKAIQSNCGFRLRELCEVLNPPEFRRTDFRDGETISEAAASVGELPNFIINEIRLKRLKTTVIERKVRIVGNDFSKWLAMNKDQNQAAKI